jgi:hypothetical protein
VAHACNPSYSGGRVQEDHGSETAQANSSWIPILKKYPTQKRAGVVAQVVRVVIMRALSSNPRFPPQPHQKKKD